MTNQLYRIYYYYNESLGFYNNALELPMDLVFLNYSVECNRVKYDIDVLKTFEQRY